MSKKLRIFISKEWLIDNYINREITIPELAKEGPYSDYYIRSWLQEYNLPVKSFSENTIISQRYINPNLGLLTKDWLEEQYNTLNKSIETISKEYNIDASAIRSRLDKFRIPVKGFGRCQLNPVVNKWHDKEFLYREYVQKNKSVKQICKECGCNQATICLFLQRFGIAANDSATYFGLRIGETTSEKVLKKLFDRVIKMSSRNHGFDFICIKNNIEYKIDCKCSSRYDLNSSSYWMFSIDYNNIADYFFCMLYDDRKNLNLLNMFMIPGYLVNKQCSFSISTKNSFNEWSAYCLPTSLLDDDAKTINTVN